MSFALKVAGTFHVPSAPVFERRKSRSKSLVDRAEGWQWTIRVSDVLKAVPTSRRSLERRFRKLLQRGVWEEIRRVHIELAKALLVDTDLSMSRIAECSGFTDARQLSIVFRQASGLTPTGWRQQFRSR